MIKLVDYFVVVGYDDSIQENKNTTNDFQKNNFNNSYREDEHYEQININDDEYEENGENVDDDDDDDDNLQNNEDLLNYYMKTKQIARGKIIQRFPMYNTNNNINKEQSNQAELNDEDPQEFDNNIHCFCQPDKGIFN